MFHFLYPWGLLSLLSVGAITFLYFFVFRGKRIEVSSLHLWRMARSLRLEGQQKRRPPITLPLILELVSALLLSLLVAGAAYSRRSAVRHLVVILDSSASMNALVDQESFGQRAARKVGGYFDELGPTGRITLVQSGFEPGILGRESLRKDEAAAELAAWRPSGPTHPTGPAVELARALGEEDAVPVLLTDHVKSVEDVQVVAVGTPLQNSGWVSCRWTGASQLFALVEHFGGGSPRKTVTIYGDGRQIGRSELDFSGRRAVPLTVTVPAGVSSVRLELPDDALANDNVLLTSRPVFTRVPVRVELEDERLARYVRRAVEATDKGVLSSSGAPAVLICSAEAERRAEAFRVGVHLPPAETLARYVGPFTVNGFHPLTGGIDLHGVIWAADSAFRPAGGETLLSVGALSLVVLDGDALTLNLDPAQSNLFTTPAWPVLISNVVDYVHERAPGLKRLSYRLGENLSFVKPASWQGRVEVERPDGQRVAFESDHIYYGRLEREGIYRVHCGGQQVAAFDVNLLSEEESDLTSAASAGVDLPAEPAVRQERAGRLFHRELALIVLAMLLCCWFLLERCAP